MHTIGWVGSFRSHALDWLNEIGCIWVGENSEKEGNFIQILMFPCLATSYTLMLCNINETVMLRGNLRRIFEIKTTSRKLGVLNYIKDSSAWSVVLGPAVWMPPENCSNKNLDKESLGWAEHFVSTVQFGLVKSGLHCEGRTELTHPVEARWQSEVRIEESGHLEDQQQEQEGKGVWAFGSQCEVQPGICIPCPVHLLIHCFCHTVRLGAWQFLTLTTRLLHVSVHKANVLTQI